MQTGDDGTFDDPAREFVIHFRGREVTVEIVHHALMRMSQRGITWDQIASCVCLPDERGLDADAGRTRVGRYETNGPRRLDVVFEWVDEDRLVVISAFWVSGRR